MTSKEEAAEKLHQLQQQLHQLDAQKRSFQQQLLEIESALKQTKSGQDSYKIVGNIMIKQETDVLQKDLAEQKEVLTLRLSTLDKQEEKFKKQTKELQNIVLGEKK